MSNTQQDNSATLLRHLEQSAVYQAEALYTSKPNWLVKNQQGQILFHLDSKTGLRYPYQQRPEDLTAEWDAKLKNSLFWELDSDFSLENGKLRVNLPRLFLFWTWQKYGFGIGLMN